MEILSEFPKELKWNVLKYLQHPTAEIMRELIDAFDECSEFGGRWHRRSSFVEFALPLDYDTCDCCAELWDDCLCWCERCGERYNECRYECYEPSSEESDSD